MPPEAWTLDLFEAPPQRRPLDAGAVLLGGFARERAPALLAALHEVTAAAPPRHLITPGGYRMSVAMSNCGAVGWVSDAHGYRYDSIDPESGRPWPAMPQVFAELAAEAADAAGYTAFAPDACLINRYEAGSRLSLHQDRDEPDKSQPIVSVSLGLSAIFLWGGSTRGGRPTRVPLVHGDVVVWGGPARLNYHGVQALVAGHHLLTGALRYNLTFRKAL